MAKNSNGKMSREQAGKKGGNQTARNHDQEFFEEIGQKGGKTTSRNHDQEFFQEIGERGGKKRARQRKSNNSSS
ncbi:stress-induced protein, KGG, repeat-containing protein [Virgibacillus dakarensis]|nr:stress-induced protein, KGG, repeat-containing protein [Virgibacillus dakarensis]MTW86195.1 stress-induced protein, KGG, repeat-containing protein [Virgibacillus dakarensis]